MRGDQRGFPPVLLLVLIRAEGLILSEQIKGSAHAVSGAAVASLQVTVWDGPF